MVDTFGSHNCAINTIVKITNAKPKIQFARLRIRRGRVIGGEIVVVCNLPGTLVVVGVLVSTLAGEDEAG